LTENHPRRPAETEKKHGGDRRSPSIDRAERASDSERGSLEQGTEADGDVRHDKR
jgi:hypothetical protein